MEDTNVSDDVRESALDRLARRVVGALSPEERAGYEQLSARYEVGRQIRAARIARGLTQSALAEASGVLQSELSRIERGQVEASHSRIRRIMQATGGDVLLCPPRRRSRGRRSRAPAEGQNRG